MKHTKKWDFNQKFLSKLLIYHEWPERITHGCSFVMSTLSDLLTVALLIWATWTICSQSLICLEGSERIACSRSFDLSKMSEWVKSKWANSQHWKKAIGSFLVSDLSHLLTVTLFSWVTWVIHSHSSLKKREWANRSGFLNLQKNLQTN